MNRRDRLNQAAAAGRSAAALAERNGWKLSAAGAAERFGYAQTGCLAGGKAEERAAFVAAFGEEKRLAVHDRGHL